MQIDFGSITAHQRYKLMASLIVPRPIALVTTVDAAGLVNAAPFSMFNMLGEDPPILMISVNYLDGGAQKDTARNIDASGEFVVHIADEPMAHKMHACGERLPPHQSEIDRAGLHTAPSARVKPPRITEAPVAFECRLWKTVDIPSRQIFIGQVEVLHARDDLIDLERYRVHLQQYHPVGRFGASYYVRTRDRYAMESGGEDPAHGKPFDEI